MQALIVGAGAVGCWFADVIGDTFAVTFYDRDAEVATAAADASDAVALSSLEDQRFALVCTAVPLLVTESVIATHASRADAAILDLSGSMSGPEQVMEEHAPSLERINLHPLFAPSHAPGRIAAAVANGGPIAQRILTAIRERGCTIVETTPAEHDRAMETVQANAHTAVIAYALSAKSIPESFDTPVSAALRDLAEMVLEGNPRVYADIQRCFGSDAVACAALQVADADDATFRNLYRAAGRNMSVHDASQ